VLVMLLVAPHTSEDKVSNSKQLRLNRANTVELILGSDFYSDISDCNKFDNNTSDTDI
jgi:hypothetical protein